MIANFTVTRTTPDKLSQQVWSFCLIDLYIVLDSYASGNRQTKRHKFVDSPKRYSRLSPRNTTMTVKEVPFPEDVQTEARQKIVDMIKIMCEYSPFELALKSAM